MTNPGTRIDEVIERWIELDPDPDTERELRELHASDPDQARSLFDGRISFGTAGLRAPMGPGPQRMNRLVVRQTTVGLMHWLGSSVARNPAKQIRVVVGYDARYNSKQFADEVATTVAENGGAAELLPEALPTPVLASAVLDRGASAGVMITASHNPAPDNGYKLYLSDGIQLTSPADSEISAAIDQFVEESLGQQPGSGPSSNDPQETLEGGIAVASSVELQGSVELLGVEMADRHQKRALDVLKTDCREVSVLYTPIHGVGGAHALACFHAAGFPIPMVVAAQFGPDPNFPTAPYPNPEDPVALAPALTEATRLQSIGVDLDLIVANDPDADRLAVTVWHPNRGWTQLTGDQLGALLLEHILRHHCEPPGAGHIVASSVVSSSLVPKMAAASGVESVRTLTGFKWLARPIADRPDARYLFGYEEALGFCVGDQVRDKDGISAALLIVEAAAEAKLDGSTLLDRLDDIYAVHGVHATGQVVVDLTTMSAEERDEAKQKALAVAPQSLDGSPVTEREDLAEGLRLPPASGIVLQMGDGSRVVIRPSGTEPKIKAYIEVVASVVGSENIGGVTEAAQHKLESLKRSVADLLANN